MNKRKLFQRLLSLALTVLLTAGLLSCAAADGMVGYYVSPTSASVNYYSLGGSSLSSLGLLSTNSAYLVTGTKEVVGEAYYEITVDGTSAYVKAANVQIASDASQSTATTTTASTTTTTATVSSGSPIGTILITPAGTTNMRSEPHLTRGNEVAQIKKNTTLALYGSVVPPSGYHVWYYCYDEASGQFGYILDDCAKVTSLVEGATLATVSGSSTTPLADPTVANSTALGNVRVTPKGKTNIRKTAKADVKNVAAQAEQGTVMPYYAVSVVDGDTWYYVYYQPSATFGYVQGKCVEIVAESAAPTVTLPQTAAGSGYVMTTTDKVLVRKKPSTSANKYGVAQNSGTVFRLAGNPEVVNGITWFPVQYGEKTGYIHGSYASVLTAAQAAAYESGQPIPTATAATATVVTTSAAKTVDYIQTTTDKVWIRSSPSTGSKAKGQALLGAVFHFTDLVTSGGSKWYKIDYAGEACYIKAKYCRQMTEAEYAEYKNSNANTNTDNTSANTGDAVQPAADPSGKAVTTIEKVIVRAEGNAKGKKIGLLYREGQLCTLVGETNVSDGYTWYRVSVNGITGWIRGDLLRILSKSEAATYESSQSGGSSGSSGSSSGSSVNGVTLYQPELIDWNTGGIQKIFAKGDTAIVTDVKTGISFKVRRWSGGDHADVEPYTAADTAAMCKIYKVSNAQQISEKNLYQRHPILVTLKGHSYAASMYGVPHNYPDGDTIANNNFNGQFCIHFINSRVHKSNKVDADHQKAIMYAYENAAKLLGIK